MIEPQRQPTVNVEQEKEFALTPEQARLLLAHYRDEDLEGTQLEQLKDLLGQIGKHGWSIEYAVGLAREALDKE
jgi:hypothetical protein